MQKTLGLILGGLLAGATAAGAARPLNVVATTPELASLAAAIAGNRARVRTITTGREDPHFLQARPNFIVMARDADLWIRMGRELEVGWEPVLLDSARNAAIRVGQPGHFDAGAFIPVVLEVPDATATRAQGDVHPSGNPHAMLDPLNARAVATALAQRFMERDPEHRSVYEAGLETFLNRLDRAMYGAALVDRLGADRLWAAETDGTLNDLLASEAVVDQLGGWRGALRPWHGKPVVTFHKSWSYLANRFGIRVVAELEPLPGVPPTPGHMASVVATIKAQSVNLILREPFYPPRPADFVARATGARVAVVSSYATDSGPDGYFRFMDTVVKAFGK